jgi:hypothetical protein
MDFGKIKYIDLIFSVLLLIGLIWIFIDYHDWVYSDSFISGKAAKAGRALLLILDKIGGKPFTMTVLTVLISPYIYSTFKKLIKGEGNIIIEIKKTTLKEEDIFFYEDNEVHIKEINPTPDGYTGKGWVEIGIVNKIKQEVEFKNIEVDEEYIAIKGKVDSTIPASDPYANQPQDEPIVRPKTTDAKPFDHYSICPACGYKLKKSDKECPDCGLNLS